MAFGAIRAFWNGLTGKLIHTIDVPVTGGGAISLRVKQKKNKPYVVMCVGSGETTYCVMDLEEFHAVRAAFNTTAEIIRKQIDSN